MSETLEKLIQESVNLDTSLIDGEYNGSLLTGDNFIGNEEQIKEALSIIRQTVSYLKHKNEYIVFTLSPEDMQQLRNCQMFKIMNQDGTSCTIVKPNDSSAPGIVYKNDNLDMCIGEIPELLDIRPDSF